MQGTGMDKNVPDRLCCQEWYLQSTIAFANDEGLKVMFL
jgi:hypothetical protein